MIPFKKIELSDKAKTDEVICASGCHGIDYNFANLFIWRKSYNPEIYFMDERMFLIMPEYGNMYAYPKGSGPIEPAIELLLRDAHERGTKLVMRGLTEPILDEFMAIYGDRFDVIEDRDNAEYIYTKDKLCNLPGRKLSSKRNHINKFLRNGDWHFDKVTAENMQEAKDFVALFYERTANPELEDEAVAIEEMFKYFDELGFIGGILYQRDTAIAFTAGTRLDEVTFDVNFEKSNPDWEGAYTMVNREFARLVAEEIPEIEIFNREEDMGIPGLRQAKESYHPDILLMKYTVKEK